MKTGRLLIVLVLLVIFLVTPACGKKAPPTLPQKASHGQIVLSEA